MTNESLVIYSMNKVEASPRSAPNKQGPALNNAYRGYRISGVHLNNAIVFPLAFANAAKRQSLWDIGHRRILYLVVRPLCTITAPQEITPFRAGRKKLLFSSLAVKFYDPLGRPLMIP